MKAPITPPTSGAAQQQFEIERQDYLSPENGGSVGGVQGGQPLWSLVWTLGTVGALRTDAWRAFIASMRGQVRRFLGWDLSRPFPKAYPNGFAGMFRGSGSTPFDGTATSWSEFITTDYDSEVSLSGLPAGFVLNQGDYIGLKWTATSPGFAGLEWHAVVRVVAAATANGAGNITVTSEPPMPAAIPLTAVAYLNNPKCVMTLIGDQSKLGPMDRTLGIKGGSIVGIQDVRA